MECSICYEKFIISLQPKINRLFVVLILVNLYVVMIVFQILESVVILWI